MSHTSPSGPKFATDFVSWTTIGTQGPSPPFLKTIHTNTQVYTLLGYGSSKPLLFSRECGGRAIETSAARWVRPCLTSWPFFLSPFRSPLSALLGSSRRSSMSALALVLDRSSLVAALGPSRQRRPVRLLRACGYSQLGPPR